MKPLHIAVFVVWLAAVGLLMVSLQPEELPPAEGEIGVIVALDYTTYGGEPVEVMVIMSADNATAWNALVLAAEQEDFSIETKDYGMNAVFVQSIQDTPQGRGGYYWIYLVNEKIAPVGADQYALENNDRVVWLFQNQPTKYNV